MDLQLSAACESPTRTVIKPYIVYGLNKYDRHYESFFTNDNRRVFVFFFQIVKRDLEFWRIRIINYIQLFLVFFNLACFDDIAYSNANKILDLDSFRIDLRQRSINVGRVQRI